MEADKKLSTSHKTECRGFLTEITLIVLTINIIEKKLIIICIMSTAGIEPTPSDNESDMLPKHLFDLLQNFLRIPKKISI